MNTVANTSRGLLDNFQDTIGELVAALTRSADTFHDYALVLTAIGKPLMAEGCLVAEAAARAAIAKCEGHGN